MVGTFEKTSGLSRPLLNSVYTGVGVIKAMKLQNT